MGKGVKNLDFYPFFIMFSWESQQIKYMCQEVPIFKIKSTLLQHTQLFSTLCLEDMLIPHSKAVFEGSF